jgi:hypothetical protein
MWAISLSTSSGQVHQSFGMRITMTSRYQSPSWLGRDDLQVVKNCRTLQNPNARCHVHYSLPATGCYPEPHEPSTSLPPPFSLPVHNAFPTLFPQSAIPWQSAGYRSSCHVKRNGDSAKVIRNSISLFTNKVQYLSINTIIRLLTLHVWALLYWAMSPWTRQKMYV